LEAPIPLKTNKHILKKLKNKYSAFKDYHLSGEKTNTEKQFSPDK